MCFSFVSQLDCHFKHKHSYASGPNRANHNVNVFSGHVLIIVIIRFRSHFGSSQSAFARRFKCIYTYSSVCSLASRSSRCELSVGRQLWRSRRWPQRNIALPWRDWRSSRRKPKRRARRQAMRRRRCAGMKPLTRLNKRVPSTRRSPKATAQASASGSARLKNAGKAAHPWLREPTQATRSATTSRKTPRSSSTTSRTTPRTRSTTSRTVHTKRRASLRCKDFMMTGRPTSKMKMVVHHRATPTPSSPW
jgi:hypothetical protein